MTEQEIKFSLYSGLYAKQPEKQISLDDLYQLTAGNLLKFKTQEVRRLTLEGRATEADAVKKSLPAIAVAGHFGERRRVKCLVAMNGMMLVDIDYARHSPAALVAQCRTLPYVAFASVSVRGGGVHLLVRIGQVDPGMYRTVCLAVAAAITRQTGEKVDESCFDLPRTMLLSHDPDCYMNPAVVPFEVPAPQEASPAASSAGSRAAGWTPQQRLAQYLDKADRSLAWVKGSRHTTLTSLAGCLNLAGFDEEDAATECVRRYATADFGEAEIRRTITSIYAAGRAEFGQNGYAGDGTGKQKLSLFVKTIRGDRDGESIPENLPQDIVVQPDSTLLPTFGEEVYKCLPRTLQKMISEAHTPREKDLDLLASLVLLSSVLPNVSGRFAGVDYHPCLYGVLIGESASGKGRIARLHRAIEPWQESVYAASEARVNEYEQLQRDYDDYFKQPKKNREGTPPVKPKVVKQMDLHIPGYTSVAKMTEQLASNGNYASCMYETEMEGMINVVDQDFGRYADVLNRVYHHETLSSNTVSRGRVIKYDPQMSMFLSGTPGMFKRLIPTTENGTFSRLLIYKLVNEGEYIPLEADDRSPSDDPLHQLGQEIIGIATLLDNSPTKVRITDAQRVQLNRFFESEFKNNWVFGNADRNSVVVRYRVTLFRIAMILTALRKAEDRRTDQVLYVSDDDYATAFGIIRVILKHAYVVATSLNHGKSEVKHLFPYMQLKFFTELPQKFKRSEIINQESVCKLSVVTIDRMLRNALSKKLIVSEGGGYYGKTSEGMSLVSPNIPPDSFDKD